MNIKKITFDVDLDDKDSVRDTSIDLKKMVGLLDKRWVKLWAKFTDLED